MRKFGALKKRLKQFDQHLANRDYRLALSDLAELKKDYRKFQLDEFQLIQLINLGTNHGQWSQVLKWMDQYIQRFDKLETRIRINKARILVVIFESPKEAIQSLNGINPSNLAQEERALYYRIKRRIRKLQNDVPMVAIHRIPKSEPTIRQPALSK